MPLKVKRSSSYYLGISSKYSSTMDTLLYFRWLLAIQRSAITQIDTTAPAIGAVRCFSRVGIWLVAPMFQDGMCFRSKCVRTHLTLMTPFKRVYRNSTVHRLVSHNPDWTCSEPVYSGAVTRPQNSENRWRNMDLNFTNFRQLSFFKHDNENKWLFL